MVRVLSLEITSKYLLNAGHDYSICIESNPVTEAFTQAHDSLLRTKDDIQRRQEH